MDGKAKQGVIAAIMLVFMLVMCGASAQAKLVPKVDNFILFPDQSGSMYMHHESLKEIKMILVKNLLLEMNELIPELGYKGSIDLFAPFQQIQAPIVYDRAKFATSIEKIKNDQEIFGRLTPMGPGIIQLDPELARMSGKTAVILISDGGANIGSDPVMEATAIHSKYPEVCFHVISFAENKKDQARLEKIAATGNCIIVQGADLLNSKAALEQFVRDVFYEDVPEKKEDVIVLRGIHFDFDKYNIKSEWRPVLDEGAKILMSHPDVSVIIEGHTDSMGTVEYNQRLSERRARAVYDYFLDKGISASRMRAKGYSELRPIADNSTEEGRALNRRVELKVEQ
ncbi:OmpA family protein [Desulforhabdus amnigena]|uniref:Membrane protein n=1 Tax=Desulforhabdus amnigena TaxID=40218 RepID=A0A9W6D1D7_9BACT|nr:OmpA family protein [Desulforhabdus amnigena]GLI34342.1 membrane protein [Desulforhabdus amnigena]